MGQFDAKRFAVTEESERQRGSRRQTTQHKERTMDELNYDGRVAIVTGAGRGIGRAHAELLAARGAHVVVNDLGGGVDSAGSSRQPASDVVAAIEAAGGRAIADFNDISTEAGANALIARTLDTFGKIDIVVNNAGNHRPGRFDEMDFACFESLISVHLNGHFLVTHAAWPHMARQEYGRVVMTTSPTGYFGNPTSANYAAAKGGIHGLMRSLAHHGSRCGINVNAIAPTAYTRMIDNVDDAAFRKTFEALRADQISPLAAWLAHEDCQVNGEVFVAGGGVVARLVVAVTEGFFDPDLTIESLRDNYQQVVDEQRYSIPGHAQDVVGPILERMRLGHGKDKRNVIGSEQTTPG